jgi:hypothetical protein
VLCCAGRSIAVEGLTHRYYRVNPVGRGSVKVWDRAPLSTMTAAQIFERAAEFAASATAGDVMADVQDAYRRLAARYAKLAAERRVEEARTL